MKNLNPYGLDETLARIRAYLSRKRGPDCGGLKLLDMVVGRAKEDEVYAAQMEKTFTRGSGAALCALMHPLPRSGLSFSLVDAVNALNAAMFHIKQGTHQE
jgi:hypothetical protein